MILLSLQALSLNLGGKTLLDEANFNFSTGERVCLLGRNGTGKTSLLQLLNKNLSPDSGEIIRNSNISFGYMPQDIPLSWTGTVFDVVASGLGDMGQALIKGNSISPEQENQLSLDNSEHIPSFNEEEWQQYENINNIIQELNLLPESIFSTLSGGSQRRVALARALASSDNLLLDEPTNHLDIKTIAWLENFLLRKIKNLIFISHDRAFSKKIATRVAEIDRGKIYSYNCLYDQFLNRREERLANEEKENVAFDKKLAQEEIWIRQGVKARRTRNMGRVRALQSMRNERIARNKKIGNVKMQAHEASTSGKIVIEAQNVCFTYEDGYEVIKDFSAIIQRGDRIGLIGDNGKGKTTLLRLLLGELSPSSGTIKLGTNLEINYFDQHRAKLNLEASVVDNITNGSDTITINGVTRHIVSYLKDFLFTPDRLRSPVKYLSGGERNRLLLARLFTKPSNLLVLDEPSNDLDADTLDLLEELLSDYAGTIIMISHDRALLDNLVTSTFVFGEDNNIQEFAGGYTDWLSQSKALIVNAKNINNNALTSSNIDTNIASNKNNDAGNSKTQLKAPKLSFNAQRQMLLLETRLKELPKVIGNLEHEQKDLEMKLNQTDFYKNNPQKFKNISERLVTIENEQLALLEEWENIEKKLKELVA